MIKLAKNFYWAIFLAVFLGFFSAPSALAFSPGETKNFSVDAGYDYANRSNVSATLQYVGDHAIFYVENNWWTSLNPVELASAKAAISNLLVEFDATIYPRLTRVYGTEWSPGIDNELRISILITQLKKGTGGYFNSIDEYPKAQIPTSNEREIIYLNTLYLGSSLVKTFLAHEFQHMINFYQKEKLRGVVEEVWLNEGRSEYTSTLCGYDNLYEGSNLEKRVADFLRNPADSLTEWENQPADYGVVNLFMQYFVGRYGEQILTKMMKSETSSIESINRALSELGFFERFSDVFANWLIASFINDCQLGEGQKYCYLNRFLTYERLHVNPIISNILSVKEGAKFSFSDSVEDWTGRWYDISPLGSGFNLLLKFKGGAGSNFYVPVIIFNKDGRKTIRYLKFDNLYNASDIILNFGNQVDKVVLIPFNRTKTAGFLVNETLFPFSFSAEITSASQIPSVSESPSVISPTPSPAPPTTPSAVKPNYNDGSLIRAKDDFKVFIVKGKYKRWIQSPQILAAYPHLGWQNVIEITSGEHDWYQSAWLIRAEGDYKVYEINSDGTKHWLNMSAEWFVNSGRSWDMVYVVNSRERDLYKTGENVLR